jgi:hypothetical protein
LANAVYSTVSSIHARRCEAQVETGTKTRAEWLISGKNGKLAACAAWRQAGELFYWKK